MAQNLILDINLNQGSYNYNNAGGGTVAGLNRIEVVSYKLPAGSNFAAQLYQNPDDTCKIAYRRFDDEGTPFSANTSSPEAQHKRVGHFMPVVLDVDGIQTVGRYHIGLVDSRRKLLGNAPLAANGMNWKVSA